MPAIEATWIDHAFVIAAFVLVFPFVGWWAYQRFLKKAAAIGGEAPLVQEYQLTCVWLVGLLIVTLAVWLGAGRPLEALWSMTPPEDAQIGSFLVIAAFSGTFFIRPVLALMSAKFRETLAQAMAPLAVFLPKTPKQLTWSLIVSVAAGVCEEIAYRGYLMPYVASFGFDVVGVIIISSLLFGLAHLYQGVMGVVQTAVIGGIFGFIYWQTGSLLAPIILHAGLDISSMLAAYIVTRRAKAA